MFKDYDKYLSASLKVYIFVLVLVLIMKLVGIDYFKIDLNSEIIINMSNAIKSTKFTNNLFHIIPLSFYMYIAFSIINKDKSKKMKIFCICIIPISYYFESYKINMFGNFAMLGEIIYYLILNIIYCAINKKQFSFLRFIIVIFSLVILQALSTIIRYKDSILYVQNPVANLILNFDYILILIIVYKLYFVEGGFLKWTDGYLDQVGLSSLKKVNLKKSLKKLQVNLHKFRALPKQERLSISIYIVLSLLWNTLSLVIILLIANLNHTFIECLFILTSFWLSKHAFGKPFHLPNMIQCFIVSNLTYYILNRITTPLGISIFIPILLGVGLSYVTSKLVKKTYKPLYRGMPKGLFDETILKIVDKDSIKYKICYDFYINKKSDLSLSFEYNYSIAGIRKIKDRINDKIKGLN